MLGRLAGSPRPRRRPACARRRTVPVPSASVQREIVAVERFRRRLLRRTDCRDSARRRPRSTPPSLAIAPPASKGTPPSRATHWSISVLPGPVSKATGSPSRGTKVTLEMPPILTKTTGQIARMRPAASAPAPRDRPAPAARPARHAPCRWRACRRRPAMPGLVGQQRAVAELHGQRLLRAGAAPSGRESRSRPALAQSPARAARNCLHRHRRGAA